MLQSSKQHKLSNQIVLFDVCHLKILSNIATIYKNNYVLRECKELDPSITIDQSVFNLWLHFILLFMFMFNYLNFIFIKITLVIFILLVKRLPLFGSSKIPLHHIFKIETKVKDNQIKIQLNRILTISCMAISQITFHPLFFVLFCFWWREEEAFLKKDLASVNQLPQQISLVSDHKEEADVGNFEVRIALILLLIIRTLESRSVLILYHLIYLTLVVSSYQARPTPPSIVHMNNFSVIDASKHLSIIKL